MTDLFATILGQAGVTDYKPCYCVGPQDGQPHCPCRMRNEKRVVMNAELNLHSDTPHASSTGTRARLAPACNVNILALDLATKCGWAYATRDGKQRSGVERFSAGKSGVNGQRWLAFRTWLTDAAREAGGFQAVYYEEVKQRFVSNLAARAYCGYLAILEAWCATNNVPMVGVGVGTVKKAWTGKGNASKEDMIAEAQRRGIKVIDDNHADALAILSYAITQET